MNFKDCLELAFKLAPETQAAGLRVMQHVDGWPVRQGVSAYSITGKNIALRDELIRCGEWRGARPPAIVFVDKPSVGLFIHELGHVSTATALPEVTQPTELHRRFQEMEFAAWALRTTDPHPWAWHGPHWIRRVIHLRYRAELAGLDVPLESLQVAGERYGLSPPSNYEHELSHEPRMMARKSFLEIEAEPLPPRFKQLFERDVLEYFKTLYHEAISEIENDH